MKHIILLALCVLTLSLTAQEQTTAVDSINVTTAEKKSKKDKKFENYVRQYKHVSRIDTIEFNSLPNFHARIDYMTKWKEKIKGLTITAKGGLGTDFDTEMLTKAASIGYRAKHFRYELEGSYGPRIINEEQYYAGQGLFGLYLDLNKLTPTPFKPYIGGNVGVMTANRCGYGSETFFEDPQLAYGFTGGMAFRVFCGFYIFAEYRQDYSTVDEIKVSHSSVNGGLRLNF